MTDSQVIAWIFFSTSLASEHEPVNFESISQVADGVNHAVPTHKELQTSLSWLTNHRLVEQTGKKYSLTNEGTELIEEAKSRTNNIILNIWDELTKEIEKTKAQQML
ncbi:hypothetical protein [Marinoscillum luteum]|uniref:Uncharacterized protein n=1 Tax=Marinoscillum luteum TaxID=861051 RepID=A0ABW7NE28_9BACT